MVHKMTWNYRVTKDSHPEQGGYVEYAIREVYYAEDGSIKGWDEDSRRLVGDSPEDIKEDLVLILTAFKKPVIDISDEDNPQEVE